MKRKTTRAGAARPVDVAGYLDRLPISHAETLRRVIACIRSDFPQLELRLAWNVPHLCIGTDYVAGFSAARDHVSLSPWSRDVLGAHRDQLGELEATTNLIRLPLGWKADRALLRSLVRSRLAELGPQH